MIGFRLASRTRRLMQAVWQATGLRKLQQSVHLNQKLYRSSLRSLRRGVELTSDERAQAWLKLRLSLNPRILITSQGSTAFDAIP